MPKLSKNVIKTNICGTRCPEQLARLFVPFPIFLFDLLNWLVNIFIVITSEISFPTQILYSLQMNVYYLQFHLYISQMENGSESLIYKIWLFWLKVVK